MNIYIHAHIASKHLANDLNEGLWVSSSQTPCLHTALWEKKAICVWKNFMHTAYTKKRRKKVSHFIISHFVWKKKYLFECLSFIHISSLFFTSSVKDNAFYKRRGLILGNAWNVLRYYRQNERERKLSILKNRSHFFGKQIFKVKEEKRDDFCFSIKAEK